MTPEIIAEILKFGPPGIIIVVLMFVIVKLYNKVDETNEKRIAESRESIKAIEQNTNTIDTLVEVLKERGRG